MTDVLDNLHRSDTPMTRAQLPASILALTTIALALILPYVHIWVHGAGRLADLHVDRYRAGGRIPEEFLQVARQAAENRIEAQGLIDAILVAGAIVVLALVGAAVARFFVTRLSLGLAFRSASMAVLVEMAFLATLYLGITLIRGQDGVRISWTGQVPTDVSRLAASGTVVWALLRGLTAGFVVRVAAFAWMLRRYHEQLTVAEAAGISAVASGAVLVIRAIAELALT